MQTKPYPISPKAITLGASLLAVSLVIAGCAKSKITDPRTSNPDRVTINDFAESAPPSMDQSNPIASAAAPTTPPPRTPTPDQGGGDDGIILTGRPNPTPSAAEPMAASTPPPTPSPSPDASPLTPSAASDSLALLDAKIGDVNGKPIFTNSFFDPIHDRLIAESARLSGEQWRISAGRIIASRLDGIIADELLRAEALTALTPNQRVGLQAFLSKFRDNLLSENLGSAQLANRRMREEKGITIDQALRQKEVDTLVQLTLITEINRRVNVSWRDIKQRYERDIDRFSPPPTANLRVIRAFADDEEKINQITTQLEEGVRFVKIAAGKLNNFSPETDGFKSVLIEDTFETTEFFGSEELNEAIRKLSIGETAGPIDRGSTIYWINLEDIEQESISLYDAQLQIQRELNFERRREAQAQYLEKLMERARVSSREQVFARLLDIAEQRYGPQG